MSLISFVIRQKVIVPHRRKRWFSLTEPFTFTADRGLKFRLYPHELLDGVIYAEGIFERRLLRFLAENFRGQVMVDVGANIGNHALYLHHNFAAVHCFEPSTVTFSRLAQNVALNDARNIYLHPVGLGDRSEELPFHQNTTGNLGGGSFVREQFPVNEILPVRRGDDILEDVRGVDLIKIDVEGFEAKALSGLKGTIDRERPVVVFEFDGSRNESSMFDEIANSLPGYVFSEFVGLQGTGLRRIINALRGVERSSLIPLSRPEGRFYEAIFAFPGVEQQRKFVATS